MTPARNRGDGKPRCWNRAPFADLQHPGDADRGIAPTVWPHRMSADCGSWKDVQDYRDGKGPTPHPVRHGWDCEGCRWKPEGGNAD